HVLLAAERQGVRRVIYASSSSVYGDFEGIKEEWMPANPISPYGVTKLGGEHHCRVWTRVKGVSTVSLRYFNVFGPGQHPDSKYAAVFPAFISALVNGKPAEIHGDGEQTRDFTFIDDVVRANLLAMEADEAVSGQVLNVCAGAPKSVNEVFRTISEVMGTSIEPVHVNRRPGDILHSHGEISKARSLLGWSPETDWQDAVKSTVDWFTRTGEPT
ncbi:MAG: NAD-dependent epimerase/dehydratase family protein, partial [Actinomycetota bacterium]|nr:NAD-dependent epimerase/dehydratase family protein [Actinomycetota bacterium]